MRVTRSTGIRRRDKLSSKVLSEPYHSAIEFAETVTPQSVVGHFVSGTLTSGKGSSIRVYFPNSLPFLRLFGQIIAPEHRGQQVQFDGSDMVLSTPFREWEAEERVSFGDLGIHAASSADDLWRLRVPDNKILKFMEGQGADNLMGRMIIVKLKPYTWVDYPDQGKCGLGVDALEIELQ